MNRAFSAYFGGGMTRFPGAMPQAKDDRAPWALTETMFVGHYSVAFAAKSEKNK